MSERSPMVSPVRQPIGLWHMLPIAAVLHAVCFWMPIQTTTAPESPPPPKTVNLTTIPLPKVSPSPVAQPTTPPPAIVRPQIQPQRPNPIPQAIVQQQPQPQPVQQSIQPQPAQQQPVQQQPVQPQPSTPPTPPDPFQLTGGQPCQGIALCLRISGGNSRLVAENYEKKLEADYQLEKLELDDETFQVYKLTHKTTRAIEYLHIIANSDVNQPNTHALRHSEPIKSRTLLLQQLGLPTNYM